MDGRMASIVASGVGFGIKKIFNILVFLDFLIFVKSIRTIAWMMLSPVSGFLNW